ncbi:sensor histidine kinase [Candidatus Rhodoblastus alkanivorans]|uniref:histidine kinase n=1 Tax=Candidatus Rhodoblastus alkanivorans TaxID=2954117 RepID=A0ABS9Z970_9HYPH|nr:sensor histidine kinase KdpD [Candidatus Rhodoblastus alkanivorans]MCI4684235.1 sensor histidine kinase KdpD [Candidatus Rhodoblastus alkanivorans]
MATERELDRLPDPDALPALAGREGRGKLKVFLGAAPGVGKTYAMLAAAQRLKAEGGDVVVGLAETHGRAETAAFLAGQEVLPRKKIPCRGRELEAFDIDAALKRRPALIVVDEFAHANPPDSRHPKRWQDVEELLDAGLDVWTTLNIQHLESLAEVVSRFIGVAVRETVPDRVLQRADDVVLVDITPDELIQRLHEGKVYLPETARRATQNFFTPRNLTALRELALRRTADRVDDQMVDLLRQHAIEGPWDTSEHLLVCVAADSQAEMVVNAGARLATRLNASWVVVHVAPETHAETDPARIRAMDRAFRLAKRLGAEAASLSSSDMIAEVLRYARRENVTQIMVGRARGAAWRRWLRRDFAIALVRRSLDIPVHVIAMPDAADHVAMPPRKRRLDAREMQWRGLFGSVAAVAVAVPIADSLKRLVGVHNVSMVFLLAVVVCAERFGLWSAVAASLLSYLAYSFFVTEPIFSFTVAAPADFLSLLAFLIVSILTSSLAGRVHDKSEEVRARARYTELLYDFSRKLSAAPKLDDALWAAAAHLHKARGGTIVFLLPQGDELRLAAAWPPTDEVSAGEMSAARWAFAKREAAGWRTDTLPNLPFQFRPLITPRGAVGVCGFEPRELSEPLSPEDERSLTAMLDQTALAIDRSVLVDEAVRSAALEENEKLRTTLLSSLSHDLKTPLSSITGAVTALRELGDRMPAEDRRDLLASIEEEAGRLARFVANLLDMSRLESGAVKVRGDFLDPTEIVRGAVERARKAFPGMRIETSLARDLPFIRGDAGLLEQVLFNLLDNAHKYGGEAGATIHARQEGQFVVLSVTDEGPGIKPGDLERIFEKFYRGGRPDGRKAGTGLGLSICKGLVEAMGGTIEAQSPAMRRRGARILARLPVTAMEKELKA